MYLKLCPSVQVYLIKPVTLARNLSHLQWENKSTCTMVPSTQRPQRYSSSRCYIHTDPALWVTKTDHLKNPVSEWKDFKTFLIFTVFLWFQILYVCRSVTAVTNGPELQYTLKHCWWCSIHSCGHTFYLIWSSYKQNLFSNVLAQSL